MQVCTLKQLYFYNLLRLIQFFNDVPFKNYKLNETNVDYSYLYFKHMENKFDKRLANQLIEKYQNTYFADYDLISYNYLMITVNIINIIMNIIIS